MCAIPAAHAGDFLKEYEPIKAKNDAAAVEKFLASSYEANKEDPEYFVAAANYWWKNAQQIDISTKPSLPGGISVADPKTGKEVGSIRTNADSHPELAKKATALLTEAAAKFPARADIAIGLAYMQHQSGSDDDCLQTLNALLDRAADPATKFLWKSSAPLPEPAATLIPEAMQDYASDFYRAQSKEGDARCRALCEHVIRVFPDHPFAYNNLAALSHTQNDEAACLKYLKLANEKDPKDALVLMNLADAQLRSGLKKEARETYQKVLKYGDNETKADARKALKGIK